MGQGKEATRREGSAKAEGPLIHTVRQNLTEGTKKQGR